MESEAPSGGQTASPPSTASSAASAPSTASTPSADAADPQSGRVAGGNGESAALGKVTVLLKAVGGAVVLKNQNFQLSSDKKLTYIVDFLRRAIKDNSQSIVFT